MDKQCKQLAKIIETVTNQYFCINGLETGEMDPFKKRLFDEFEDQAYKTWAYLVIEFERS